jgi:hypothetical protein
MASACDDAWLADRSARGRRKAQAGGGEQRYHLERLALRLGVGDQSDHAVAAAVDLSLLRSRGSAVGAHVVADRKVVGIAVG